MSAEILPIGTRVAVDDVLGEVRGVIVDIDKGHGLSYHVELDHGTKINHPGREMWFYAEIVRRLSLLELIAEAAQ